MAQTACMSSCKYLATKLREMLLDDEVRVSSVSTGQNIRLVLKVLPSYLPLHHNEARTIKKEQRHSLRILKSLA